MIEDDGGNDPKRIFLCVKCGKNKYYDKLRLCEWCKLK